MGRQLLMLLSNMNYVICGVLLFGCVSVLQVQTKRLYAVGFMSLGSRRQVDIMQSQLLVSSSGKAKFEVTIPTLSRPISITLSAGKYYRFVLDPFKERALYSGKVEDTGIIIQSDEDICVHGISFDYMTYGGFHAQPLMADSTSFYVPGYSIKSGRSQILISAAEARTRVSITLPGVAGGAYGNSTLIILNKYEVYQLEDSALDFTGTHIQSDKPIGVFAGVDCAQVPAEVGFCDNMVVGVPSVQQLGQRFIVAPLSNRRSYTGYLVRTLATADNTTVTNNDETRTLSRGGFWEVDAKSSSHIMDITCSEPCLVVQYSKGSKVDDTKWDPFMMVVPPVKDYSNKLIWANAVDRHGMSMQSYANIVAPAGKEDGVVVDGKNLTSRWTPVPGGAYMVTAYILYMGVHQAWHVDGVTKIGVTTYGRGTKESIAYGYPACASGSHFMKATDNETESDDKESEEPTCGSDPSWIQQCCLLNEGASPGAGDEHATNTSVGDEDVGSTDAASDQYKEAQVGPSSEDKDKEPMVAGSSSCRPVAAGDNHLLPLWFVLCILAGVILGVLITILSIWCRVRNLKGIAPYIFNPCAENEETTSIRMSEA